MAERTPAPSRPETPPQGRSAALTIGVIGAGGHARVVASCARLVHESCDVVLFDQRWPELVDVSGYRVIGRDPQSAGFMPADGPLLLAIGDNATRGRICEAMREMGYDTPRLIHPSAVVAPEAAIEDATFLAAGAIVNPHARVGRGVILNSGSIIEHDCVVGDYVHVSPGAILAGGAEVGAYSWIGAGATVIHGVSIASGIIVGAGAVVTCNIDTPGTYVGVPARRIG